MSRGHTIYCFMSVPPIYFIVGAPASGKSTAAKALARRFAKCIVIPVDEVREFVQSGLVLPSFDWSPALVEQLECARASVVAMAGAYRKAGFAVIIDDFYDQSGKLAEYSQLVNEPNVHQVLLFPDPPVAQARQKARDGSGGYADVLFQAIVFLHGQYLADMTGIIARGWHVIDTTCMTVEQTLDAIVATASSRPQLS